MNGRWFTVLSTGLAAVALAFFVLPVLVVLGRALQAGAPDAAGMAAIAQALGLSLVTTLLTLLLTTVFGTPLAYILATRRFPLRRAVGVLVELPIVLPPAVAGLALLTTLGRNGALGPVLSVLGIQIPFTILAVVLAQTFVAAPFYVRAAVLGFQGVPRALVDAAGVDGAHGWPLFRHIMLPVARRALLVGLVLCWARALGEFGATILFAGNLQGRTQTMPLLIYSLLERDVNASLWAGAILIGMALLALLLAAWLRRRDDHALE
jgi:molybdate transport system permease protein